MVYHMSNIVHEMKMKENLRITEAKRRKNRYKGYSIVTVFTILTLILTYFGWPASGYTLGILAALLGVICGCMLIKDNR